MNYTNLGLGNRLQELSNMEQEERASRLAGSADQRDQTSPMRVATGRAMVRLGSRLMGEPGLAERSDRRPLSAVR